MISLDRLYVSYYQLAVAADSMKLNLVARLYLVQQGLVFDGEHHRHAGHVEVLDFAVFKGNFSGVLVNLLDFTVGHVGCAVCGLRSRFDIGGC